MKLLVLVSLYSKIPVFTNIVALANDIKHFFTDVNYKQYIYIKSLYLFVIK